MLILGAGNKTAIERTIPVDWTKFVHARVPNLVENFQAPGSPTDNTLKLQAFVPAWKPARPVLHEEVEHEHERPQY